MRQPTAVQIPRFQWRSLPNSRNSQKQTSPGDAVAQVGRQTMRWEGAAASSFQHTSSVVQCHPRNKLAGEHAATHLKLNYTCEAQAAWCQPPHC